MARIAVFMMLAATVSAQAPDPPGPWVIDVRGVTSSLPASTAFFPPVPEDTLVPSRGFGFDVGAHLYPLSLGPARVGVGANYLQMRGTGGGITTDVRTLAPQVSFNFGTVNGWSYVSGGFGRGWVKTAVPEFTGATEQESGGLGSSNYGGGARWFLTPHIAVGLDIRWHRLSGEGRKATLLSAAVGFSVH